MDKKTFNTRNTESSEPDNPAQDRFGLDRLVFFSDGVFAIAITLLVLEIRLPGGQALDDAQLLAGLLEIWHKYLAYAISFLVIGTFWISHHRKFRYIRRYDGRLLMFNLFFLMVVAFIPFPSSVISETSNSTATIFYALTMVLAGFWMAALWSYASRNNRLTDPHLDAPTRRRELARPLTTSLLFLVSIGIALINGDVARLSWFLILPLTLYANRGRGLSP